MRKMLLSVGAAALAISTPVLADQSQGRGNDNKPAKAERGGGKPDQARGQGRGNQGQTADRGNRGNGNDQARGNRGNGNGQGQQRAQVRDRDDVRDVIRDTVRVRENGRRVVQRSDYDRYDYRYGDNGRGLVNGCPPGLAKKGNGCLPPGQAKKMWGQQIAPQYADRRLMGPYANWYRDDDEYRYRMGNDYIYRIGTNGLIAGLIPLYNRSGYYYPVGSQYPSAYDFYNVPSQYRGYYSDPYYRYGDGAIYRVDPETQLIRSVVALLAGDLSVGQPLPPAYNVYNMPMAYRSTYYDTPQNYYRYNDGYVYRVDPTTMLVSEVIKAII